MYEDMDMVILAILDVADCTMRSLDDLVKMTLNADQTIDIAVVAVLRELVKEGFVTSYRAARSGKRFYICTRQGRAYLSERLAEDCCKRLPRCSNATGGYGSCIRLIH